MVDDEAAVTIPDWLTGVLIVVGECGGGTELVAYELTGEDAWDTCTAAADQCMEIVYSDGVIGGGSSGNYYGDDIFREEW